MKRLALEFTIYSANINITYCTANTVYPATTAISQQISLMIDLIVIDPADQFVILAETFLFLIKFSSSFFI